MSVVNQGAIKTLMTMLRESPYLEGVAVRFGEESSSDQDAFLPMVSVFPIGGPVQPGIGYARQTDYDLNDVDNVWILREQFNLVIWASENPNENPPPTAVDNAVAIENVRRKLLCALQSQAPSGLFFVPQGGQWALFGGQELRYGRGYVLTVQVDITYTSDLPVQATVTKVVVTPEIEA